MPSYGTPPAHSIANGYHTALENSCHPGKILWMRLPRVQTPVLWRPSTAALFGIDRCDSSLHYWSSWGKASVKEPPSRVIQPPEFQSLVKAELWLVIWARSSPELWAGPTSLQAWPPCLSNCCSGRVSSEFKCWNCLCICWVWSTNHRGKKC